MKNKSNPSPLSLSNASTAHFWVQHFQHNLTQERVNWQQAPSITSKEKKRIIPSLKAWQLGETSDGKHLIAAATKYAAATNDPVYLQAIRLFIKEEQKHGNNLGRYLDLIGEKRKKWDLGDSLFRWVRYFNTSIEMWTITVIIVESYAQIFYKAVHDATNCKLLKEICVDILKDEAYHIKFQQERLSQIVAHKSFWGKQISLVFYKVLFYVITLSVWIAHRKAFKAGGLNFGLYAEKALRKFKYMEYKLTQVGEPAIVPNI